MTGERDLAVTSALAAVLTALAGLTTDEKKRVLRSAGYVADASGDTSVDSRHRFNWKKPSTRVWE